MNYSVLFLNMYMGSHAKISKFNSKLFVNKDNCMSLKKKTISFIIVKTKKLHKY